MKIIIIIGVILIVCVVLILFYWEAILLSIGDFLVIQDDLQHADVIHVIAGPDYRTEHAIQLYQQGYGEVIFFTGGWCKGHQYYHGEHGMQLALVAGVPQEAIGYDDSAVTSTYDETERLRDWIQQRPVEVHKVIVVSDPFHMRRAQWTYRKVLEEGVEVWMAPVAFEATPHRREWWGNVPSERYVKDEYLKYFYYIARYQLSWGGLNKWLISLDKE